MAREPNALQVAVTVRKRREIAIDFNSELSRSESEHRRRASIARNENAWEWLGWGKLESAKRRTETPVIGQTLWFARVRARHFPPFVSVQATFGKSYLPRWQTLRARVVELIAVFIQTT